MNDHPDPPTLAAFRARRLPPAAMRRIDQHVAHCADCRGRATPAAALAVLAAVSERSRHLDYEQLAAYTDRRAGAEQGAAIEAHVAWCPMCRRELDDLTAHAQALRRSPAPQRRADGWRAWWAGAPWRKLAPPLAMASVAGAAVVTLMSPTDRNPRDDELLRQQPGAAALLFDHSVLERLDGLSPAAAAAWRRNDYAALAALLQPLAERRDPLALAALASLHAQGLGMPRDLQAARRLWSEAAQAGFAGAAENAERARRQAAGGG